MTKTVPIILKQHEQCNNNNNNDNNNNNNYNNKTEVSHCFYTDHKLVWAELINIKIIHGARIMGNKQ